MTQTVPYTTHLSVDQDSLRELAAQRASRCLDQARDEAGKFKNAQDLQDGDKQD